MTVLSAGDFDEFFEAVHGTPPFPWQRRLAALVIGTGAWPGVIDLPTGSGKTAALDVATFALACDPAAHPRRVVFVIDRRVVVDQVAERGRRLAAAMGKPRSEMNNVVRVVADRLSALAPGGDPLLVAALRGGVAIDDAWALRPDQPSLIVSTVDQLGSRLLFRGYGVSQRMRPVHAGLAGADCLVVLDEVHLARPFAAMLGSIARHYRPHSSLPDRWRVVEMSATPGASADDVFRLEDEDIDPVRSPELAARATARKSVTLTATGSRNQQPWEILPAFCTQQIADFGAAGTVGVVVNRVRTARAVAQHLRSAGHDVCLLTGRMRAFDRADALDRVAEWVDPERAHNGAGSNRVVVGTQCIEVGADFSFDALITECAALDALRQRFGRLDRRGRAVEKVGAPARAVVVGTRSTIEAKASDPVYGDALKATWRALIDRHGDRPFDGGPLSEGLGGFGEEVLAPAPIAPVLLESHLDAFVQTWPSPAVEPSPDPFLHGLDRATAPDVRLVWRADIDPNPARDDARLEAIRDRLLACPPRVAESMPVPIDAARTFLAGSSEEVAVSDADAEAEEAGALDRGAPCALRWRSRDDIEPVGVADIRPGDLLIIPADRGGISEGNWDPGAGALVEDHGDRAQFAYGRRAVLRLDPRVLPPGVPVPPTPCDDVIDSDSDLITAWLSEARTWCDASDPPVACWFADVISRLDGTAFQVTRLRDPDTYAIGARLAPELPAVDPELLDASDEASCFTGADVALVDHLHGVAAKAREFAESLALPPAVVEDLELAGRLHDLGKADPRFQLMLHAGDEVEALCASDLLAKSRRMPSGSLRRSHGYPKGMRHELLSVAMLLSAGKLLARCHDPDLVLHLVASHHGYCRPLPRIVDDPSPRSVAYLVDEQTLSADTALDERAVGPVTAERFWRVVEHYGWYGTAWLEAIFRLADHRRSEEETQGLTPALARTSA